MLVHVPLTTEKNYALEVMCVLSVCHKFNPGLNLTVKFI